MVTRGDDLVIRVLIRSGAYVDRLTRPCPRSFGMLEVEPILPSSWSHNPVTCDPAFTSMTSEELLHFFTGDPLQAMESVDTSWIG